MKRFDRKFLALLKRARVELTLYRRYIDDGTKALDGLDPGVRWEEGKIVVKAERTGMEDRHVEADKRKFEELATAAGTVFKCLDFIADSLSRRVSEKLPVLDLHLFVNQQGKIIHEFYEKPT